MIHGPNCDRWRSLLGGYLSSPKDLAGISEDRILLESLVKFVRGARSCQVLKPPVIWSVCGRLRNRLVRPRELGGLRSTVRNLLRYDPFCLKKRMNFQLLKHWLGGNSTSHLIYLRVLDDLPLKLPMSKERKEELFELDMILVLISYVNWAVAEKDGLLTWKPVNVQKPGLLI